MLTESTVVALAKDGRGPSWTGSGRHYPLGVPSETDVALPSLTTTLEKAWTCASREACA